MYSTHSIHIIMSIILICLHSVASSILSGGADNRHQAVEYNILSDTFTDFGEDYLSSTLGNSLGEYGSGSFFTQINATTMFTIESTGDAINMYDLVSLSWTQLDTVIPESVNYFASLASAETPSPRLYITAPYDAELQVFDIDSNEWLSDMPDMNNTWIHHQSIVVGDALYVFGRDGVTDIESINITELDYGASWEIFAFLPFAWERMGVIAGNREIYIIGGYDGTDSLDAICVIDTVSRELDLYDGVLPYHVGAMAVVVVDGIVYGFGGISDGDLSRNDWISYEMLMFIAHHFML